VTGCKLSARISSNLSQFHRTICIPSVDEPDNRFKSKLPDLCALLRSKLFPHSPFSEGSDDNSRSPSPSIVSVNSVRANSPRSVNSTVSRKLDKPSMRNQDDVGSTALSRSRSRSLSVTLAQDLDARRVGSVGTQKRHLNREVSMSRNFKPKPKPKPKPMAKEGLGGEGPKIPQKRRSILANDIGVTLVEATPVKSKTRSRTFQGSPIAATQQGTHQWLAEPGQDEEEIWVLPGLSSDILLRGSTPDSPASSMVVHRRAT
jgi:hypothetical protein